MLKVKSYACIAFTLIEFLTVRDRVNKEFKKQKFFTLLQILFIFQRNVKYLSNDSSNRLSFRELNFLFRKYKKVLEIIRMLAMPSSAPWVSVEEWGHTAMIYLPT